MRVDLDAFYVSVEQRKDPALAGRPVIVGGVPGERGVVASASYEARAYGVRAGMPLGRAALLCPGAVFLHGDHADYERASTEVMGILREFAPHVEPVSLDEAFLDLTGCDRVHGVRGTARGASWLDAAEGLHREVLRRTGLSVSIGIGGTKAVAGVAAALAKPAGAVEVPRGAEAAFLANLPVEVLPGVGPKMREALARYNLHVVGDLARLPEELLEETFGKAGVALSRRARGLDDGEVRDGRPGPQSISRETSFPDDTSDRAVIGGMLSYLAQRATAALRSERLRAGAVGIRLRYADFRTVEVRRRLSSPSDRDRDVLALVSELWPKRYDRRVKLRLVGVTLLDLTPATERQLDLFQDLEVPRGAQQSAQDRASAHAGAGTAAGTADGGVDGVAGGKGASNGGAAGADPAHGGGASGIAPGAAPAAARIGASAGRLDAVVDRLRARHGFGILLKGRAIDCLARVPSDLRGLKLRTPSCSG